MTEYDVTFALENNSRFIEQVLEDYCKFSDGTALGEAIRYSLLGGGKRIRAYLVRASGEMFGADKHTTAPYAASIEMIHAYSLIHDDLPSMDNDDTRRGKPSCHIAFGEPTALLAGDALLSLAFQTCASNTKTSAASNALVANEYGKLSGIHGMALGQMIDLANSADSYEKLLKMYDLKTGALIRASLLAGYFASTDTPDSSVIEILNTYGSNLGIAFQIKDDVLDVVSDTETLGKPVGSDESNKKNTATYYKSIDEAVSEYKMYTERAIQAIGNLDNSMPLIALAKYLTDRIK